MGERVSPDTPWILCLGCDHSFSRRSAPNPIHLGDFSFRSIECHSRWFNEDRLGMSAGEEHRLRGPWTLTIALSASSAEIG